MDVDSRSLCLLNSASVAYELCCWWWRGWDMVLPELSHGNMTLGFLKDTCRDSCQKRCIWVPSLRYPFVLKEGISSLGWPWTQCSWDDVGFVIRLPPLHTTALGLCIAENQIPGFGRGRQTLFQLWQCTAQILNFWKKLFYFLENEMSTLNGMSRSPQHRSWPSLGRHTASWEMCIWIWRYQTDAKFNTSL